MKLAEKFMYVHADARDGTVYTAEETDTGDYRVSWLDDGHSNFKTLPYDRMDVHSSIVSGEWIVRAVFPLKEEVPLEPSDELVSWPFPVSTVVTVLAPEFLPPDDIPDLVPESLSLVAVRQFVKEFPQYTLELDEEYMVVKPVENSHGERSVVYLAKTEAELEAIMDAIRTLERFADRG